MNFVDRRRSKLPESLDVGLNEAAIFNNRAIILENSGDGHTALEYYVEALKIFFHRGDLNNKAIVLNNIGGLFKNHGVWSEALDCFHEVSEIMHENGNRVGEAAALCNIGIIYMNLGNFRAMLKFELQAFELIQGEAHPDQEAACRSGIALALYGMGKTNQAIPYLEQGVKLLENNNLPCDADGTSIGELRELIQTMKIGEPSETFNSIELSNAMKAFITAASWDEALQIFKQHKTLLSLPEVEASLKEGITQMRQSGEMQKLSNLQAHLKLLQRAKKHYSRSSHK